MILDLESPERRYIGRRRHRDLVKLPESWDPIKSTVKTMKALIQRVKWAKVEVDGREIASIGPGLLVFLGVSAGDVEDTAGELAGKVTRFRIFEDGDGKMNLSLNDTNGQVLVVSQFTLVADTSRGNRPGFGQAAAPDAARGLYELFVASLKSAGIRTKTGSFGAAMTVTLANDGPVTFILTK